MTQTIFNALDNLPGSGDALNQVSTQAAQLRAAAKAIESLAQHPSIGDLVGSLHALPLPDLSVAEEVGTALNSISSALPADAKSVTNALATELAQFQETHGTDLAQALS